MNFNYIEDTMLKQHAIVLWAEANLTRQNKLMNATGALSGATVEDALLAVFEQLGDYPENIDRLPLGNLIGRLKEKHGALIPDHILSTAEAVRDYRNLFHPGRARRVGIIGEEEAEAAFSQAQVMLKWLFEWSNKRFSLTASKVIEQHIMMNPLFKPKEIHSYRNLMTKNEWDSLATELGKKNAIFKK